MEYYWSSSSSSCHATSTDIPDPLATFPYRSSPPAGLQSYILYHHIAAECMFVLVILLLPGHMWGSIRVHHLWAHPCFFSSVLWWQHPTRHQIYGPLPPITETIQVRRTRHTIDKLLIIWKFDLSDKMGFLSSCNCVHTTIWMHYVDTNKTHWGKARWKIHKNAMYCLEQILETKCHKTLIIQLPTSQKPSKMNKRCMTLREKLEQTFMYSYTWMWQCWPTFNDLYTLVLCGHCMQPTGSTMNDSW